MRRTTIIFFLLCLSSLLSSDLSAQRKDTSDYFAVGLYTGSYIGQKPLYEQNNYFNSIAIELEYYKFSDLSFYVQGIYEFTGSDVGRLFDIPYWYKVTVQQKPETYRLVTSFGGRYYLRNKTVNPFFQLGINHETNFIGSYDYIYEYPGGWGHAFSEGYYFYRLAVNLGVGLSIKLNDKFKLEGKYDLYKSLIESNDEFTSYSVLGGLKYNL